MQQVNMNLKVNEYTSRVLGVVKEKFGLNDKAEALNKFADMFGEEFVDREVKEEVVNKMIRDCEEWAKTYKFKRKMTFKELDELCGIKS